MNRNFHIYGFVLALLIHLILVSSIVYLLIYKTEEELTQDSAGNLLLNLKDIHPHSDQEFTSTASHQTMLPDNETAQSTMNEPYNQPIIQTNELKEEITAIPKNIGESIKRHYGDEFYDLSEEQQQYIMDNLKTIRKINEIIGTRLLRSRPSDEIDPTDSNMVEFYLYPDGSISDLYLYEDRSNNMLDELTLDTIKLAHPNYPKPKTKTLIRIRVWILVKE